MTGEAERAAEYWEVRAAMAGPAGRLDGRPVRRALSAAMAAVTVGAVAVEEALDQAARRAARGGCPLAGLLADALARAGEGEARRFLERRLGTDPLDRGIRRAGLLPGVVRLERAGDSPDFVSLPHFPVWGAAVDAAQRRWLTRAAVVLPLWRDWADVPEGAAAPWDMAFFDLEDPVFFRLWHGGRAAVMPWSIGGAVWHDAPVPARLRVWRRPLDWLRAHLSDTAAGVAPRVVRHAFVGDWPAAVRDLAGPGGRLCAAVLGGRTALVFDDDDHADEVRQILLPPRPKLKLEVAA